MITAGIICEYNPFHKGHKYHIEETRIRTGADAVICVMSGSFVQRGEPALLDKHVRTRMALLGGADLVLELPLTYALSSAEGFARGGVEILHRLGVVDYISFGSETDDPDLLRQAASQLNHETPEFKSRLAEGLKQGETYAAARCTALGEELGRAVSAPNSLLAVEYLRALEYYNCPIKPCLIPRVDNGYHDRTISEGFSSATALRRALKEGAWQDALRGLDRIPAELYADIFSGTAHLDNADFADVLLYRILTSTLEELTACPSIDEALANRIRNLQYDFNGWEAFVDRLKTRNRTRTRISRALWELVLGVKASDKVDNVRILGFRKSAAPLLAAIREVTDLTLLTTLAGEDPSLYFSDTLYEGIRAKKRKAPFLSEPSKPMVIID